MTINRRIRQRGVYVAFIAFVYLMTGIFASVQAQSFAPHESDQGIRVSNTYGSIFHVPFATTTPRL